MMTTLQVVLNQLELEQDRARHVGRRVLELEQQALNVPEGQRVLEPEQQALNVPEGQRDEGREGLAGEARVEHVVQEQGARVQSRLEPDPSQKIPKLSSHSQVQPGFAQLVNFLTNAPADVTNK